MKLTEEDKQKTVTADLLTAEQRVAKLERHIQLDKAMRRTFAKPFTAMQKVEDRETAMLLRAKIAEDREVAMLQRAKIAEDREAAMLQRAEAAEYRAELAEEEVANLQLQIERMKQSHTSVCNKLQEVSQQNHSLLAECRRLREQHSPTTPAPSPTLSERTVLSRSESPDNSPAFFATANEPHSPIINTEIYDYAADGPAYVRYLRQTRNGGQGS